MRKIFGIASNKTAGRRTVASLPIASRRRHEPCPTAGATPKSIKLLEPSILDGIKKSGFVEPVK